MIEYLQGWTNDKRFRPQSLFGHTSKFKKSPVIRNLCKVNYENKFPPVQIWLLLCKTRSSDWLMMLIISH